jgi:CRISPR-associated endonuclease Csn1
VVVSFWEAVKIGLNNIKEKGNPYPIIERRDHPEYGRLVFTMQLNDLFVLDWKHAINPQAENEINFFDTQNREKISKKIYRLQTMSKKTSGEFDIMFRHQFETTLKRNISDLTNINIRSNKNLKRLTKISFNSVGKIIKIESV